MHFLKAQTFFFVYMLPWVRVNEIYLHLNTPYIKRNVCGTYTGTSLLEKSIPCLSASISSQLFAFGGFQKLIDKRFHSHHGNDQNESRKAFMAPSIEIRCRI